MTTAPPRSRSPRGRWHQYLPPEHGAWAMLLLPFLSGTALAGGSSGSPLLLVGWLLTYLVSYYATAWWRARRKRRFVAPLRLYLALLVPTALALVAIDPRLLLAALALTPLLAVNVFYAKRGDLRAWPNGVASATAACSMGPIAYVFAGGSEAVVASQLFVILWLYFTGSLLYVKTMIRERGNRRFIVASAVFHALAVVVAAAIDPWFALPFGLFLIRTLALPRHQVRPARVGALEVVNSLLLLACTVWLL